MFDRPVFDSLERVPCVTARARARGGQGAGPRRGSASAAGDEKVVPDIYLTLLYLAPPTRPSRGSLSPRTTGGNDRLPDAGRLRNRARRCLPGSSDRSPGNFKIGHMSSPSDDLRAACLS